MTRYFFDFIDDDSSVCDDDGLEYATYTEARRAALEALPELAKEALVGDHGGNLRLRVRDETGTYRFECSMTLATTEL